MSHSNFLFVWLLFALAAPAIAEEEDFHTRMVKATVKISHARSTATGFLLTTPHEDGERSILVTADHVLEMTPGDETTVEFRIQEGEGEYRKEIVKLLIRKEGKPLWAKHATEDVAAIRIDPPKNTVLPKIPLDCLASDASLKQHKVHPGEILTCLGYPHRNEANEAGFPILRAGPIGSFPLVPTQKLKTFFLSANTFEGDSGGPVYLSRPPTPPDLATVDLILGVISAQRFLDEEMKMVYGTTKIRHRLGLAIVIHASFIKETIDLLP